MNHYQIVNQQTNKEVSQAPPELTTPRLFPISMTEMVFLHGGGHAGPLPCLLSLVPGVPERPGAPPPLHCQAQPVVHSRVPRPHSHVCRWPALVCGDVPGSFHESFTLILFPDFYSQSPPIIVPIIESLMLIIVFYKSLQGPSRKGYIYIYKTQLKSFQQRFNFSRVYLQTLNLHRVFHTV